LDVLFLHNPDPTTNEAETVDSMVELFEGKVIKSIGFSNVDDTQLNRYMNSLRRNSIYEIPIYVQNEFNWSTRKSSFWALLLENYQDFKIFSVSYGVLQQGLLAQTFENYKRSQIQDEMKRANKSIKVGNFLTNKKLEDCLKALDIELNSMGSNLFEFSMNFSLKYSNYSIWGVRNLEQLKKLDSETSVNLTDLEFTRLENKYLT
jgi:aryl-alcohol dehydrogenase-like predicted oxidoreductase